LVGSHSVRDLLALRFLLLSLLVSSQSVRDLLALPRLLLSLLVGSHSVKDLLALRLLLLSLLVGSHSVRDLLALRFLLLSLLVSSQSVRDLLALRLLLLSLLVSSHSVRGLLALRILLRGGSHSVRELFFCLLLLSLLVCENTTWDTECQAFCPVIRTGSPFPPLHPQKSVAPRPLWVQGGRHTCLRGREWGHPILTMGQTLWYSMYTIIPLSVGSITDSLAGSGTECRHPKNLGAFLYCSLYRKLFFILFPELHLQYSSSCGT
jgi:hypothetical protein